MRTNRSVVCWGVVTGHPGRGPSQTRESSSPEVLRQARAYPAWILRIDQRRSANSLVRAEDRRISVACWGFYHPLDRGQERQSGSYITVSAGDLSTCAGCGPTAPWHAGASTPFNFLRTSDAVRQLLHLRRCRLLGCACGLREDGSITCWGSREIASVAIPVGPFVSVGVGIDHACALTTEGSVSCWGSNEFQQANPQAVRPIGPLESISLGGGSSGSGHSCGVRSDGSVVCWGANESGQATPPGGSFHSISLGNRYTCGVRTDRSVVCWGANESGQATPPGGSFHSISFGDGYSCGVRTDRSGRLLGRERVRPGLATVRSLHIRRRWLDPYLWIEARWLRRVLGLEPLEPDPSPSGDLYIHQRRGRPHLWGESGRFVRVLGR